MREDLQSADVVVVGAGPTGLMLAIELCLGGVTPVVLETLPEISEIPKGNGFFGLIVQVLDYRGLLDPLRAEATFAGPVPRFFFGPLTLDFSGLDTSPLQVLAAPQRTIERKLAERLTDLGGTVRRGHERGDRPRRRLPAPHPLSGGLRRRAQRCPQTGRHRLPGCHLGNDREDR